MPYSIEIKEQQLLGAILTNNVFDRIASIIGEQHL
jgi:hypothetical protein